MRFFTMKTIVPHIVVSPGCPSGVGPELLVRSFAELNTACSIIWSGGNTLLERSAAIAQVALRTSNRVSYHIDDVVIHCIGEAESQLPSFAHPDERALRLQKDYLLTAIRALQEKKYSALVTGPVRKKALQEIDSGSYPGQTELLQGSVVRKTIAMRNPAAASSSSPTSA
jgi:4-hydroxy-L-threonine phosphate dehydrogenase PdxA